MIDIKPEQLETVKNIFRQWLPQHKVAAFGSRARKTAKPHSDLDLAIFTDQPISLNKMAHLRDAFSASNLPFKVDLVDTSLVDQSFLKVIEAQAVSIID